MSTNSEMTKGLKKDLSFVSLFGKSKKDGSWISEESYSEIMSYEDDDESIKP